MAARNRQERLETGTLTPALSRQGRGRRCRRPRSSSRQPRSFLARLNGADVEAAAFDAREAGAALVEVGEVLRVGVAAVDGWAAGLRQHGLGRSAVGGQWREQRIDRGGAGADLVAL